MEDVLTYDAKPWEWLNPIAMDRLQTAVKGKKKEVTLDGIKFNITYGYRRDYPVSRESVDSVHLTRADGGFVPRGYISVKRIMDFKFEEKS